MSNKETLQEYNNKLIQNNEDLQTVINMINNLPTAGGGEDISEELTDYDAKLTTQETTLEDIVTALQGKASGGNTTLLQEKVIEVNDEYMLDIIPDEGFYGLSKVSIKVNPNKYAAYQMLEYIKGTSYVAGSNYFLTGLYPTNKTTLEMKYSFYKNDNNYSNLYGSSRQFLAQSTTANDTRVVALWNNELIGNMSGFNNFNAHVIKQDKNVMYFDGVLKQTCTPAEWVDENELKLFGLTGGQDASAILYYCKIWEDDVLVRDFVPCYRKSDNAVGLLDKVENKFYENAGTVPFEKGPNI